MKKSLVVLVVVAAILAAYGLTQWLRHTPPDATHGTYLIDGKAVTLGSTSGTAYFGNSVSGDLDGDGSTDTAFILTQSPGGSGTFYYVAVMLGDGKTTNAVFLGDRIAPQTTEIHDGQVVVNYATRAPTDAFTTPPSVNVSMYLKVSGTALSQVQQ